MQSIVVGVLAAILGIVVGHWLRGRSLGGEKALLVERNQQQTVEINGLRSELAASQNELSVRAGYGVLADERERALDLLKAERDGLRNDIQVRGEAELQSAARISQLETALENEKKNLAEKLTLLEDAKKALTHQFEAVAADILDKKSKSFSEDSQKELGTLLTPLREQIKDFREKVEQSQSDSKTGVTKLETLIGTLHGMNQQLSQEAQNLTTALRGSSKAQGDWGEFLLRDLLEKAGLREGEQYTYQQSFTGIPGTDGERSRTARTDVIVSLPGNRSLIIDSKASLNAYADFANATGEEERKAALKQHLVSMRAHVNGLSKAGYSQLPGIESPDFIVMFIPIEPAFLLALQNDSSLWADAYEKGILLVGPTTLLYVIRIVNVLWQQEAQSRNVKEVMDRGAELYDKFVGFVNSMESVGEGLRKADQNYSNAMKQLSTGRGNLIRQAEMLKGLGLRTTKSLPKNLLDESETENVNHALPAEVSGDAATNGLR